MRRKKKLIEAHKIETAVNIIILTLAVFSVFVFILALKNPYFTDKAIIIEMFIIILIAILAQTAILTKLMEKVM